MKRRKGNILLESILVMVIIGIGLNSYFLDPKEFMDGVMAKEEIQNLVTIDQFLYHWAESHAGEFPDSLKKLEFTGLQINTSKYIYEISAEKSKYQLHLNSTSGAVISPKSNW